MIGSGIPISQSNAPFPNDMIVSMLSRTATRSGSISSIAGFPCRARSQAAANPLDRSTQRTNREGRHCSARVRKEFVREAPGTISRAGVQYDRG